LERREDTMKKVAMVLVLAVVFFAAEATAQMGQGKMGHGMMGGMGAGMMPRGAMASGGMGCQNIDLAKILHQWGSCFFTQKEQLGLTDEQLDQIQSILNSHMKYAIRKNADGRVLLIEIQELLVKEKVNLGEVKGKVQSLEGLNTDMNMEGVRTLEEALGVLTPEQQKKAKALFKTSTCMGAMGMGGTHSGAMMGQEGMMGGPMMKEMKGQGGAGADKESPEAAGSK
jgi:Spy/CpxP family protein refolding chaperone